LITLYVIPLINWNMICNPINPLYYYMWSYYLIENIICDPNMQLKTLYVILLCNWKQYMWSYYAIENIIAIDAQSLSNSFEGVLGVARNLRKGSSIFLIYCNFMTQFFKVLWEGTWGAQDPLLPPPPPPLPMCIYDYMWSH